MASPQNKTKHIKVFTIDVYGSSEIDFFKKLKDSGVDLFCDIRMRRAVRGSQYAFVNSKRLQSRLDELRIPYLYMKELAPTKDTREKQREVDKAHSVQKRKREELSNEFIEAYKADNLAEFDAKTFIDSLGDNVKSVAFFCVEAAPAACHRSLVATEIANYLNVEVTNL